MKRTHIILLTILSISIFSCILNSSSNNRASGVCYCDYVNGEKKQFDLNHLSRAEQIDTCNLYSKNAGFFGGKCELQ